MIREVVAISCCQDFPISVFTLSSEILTFETTLTTLQHCTDQEPSRVGYPTFRLGFRGQSILSQWYLHND